MESPSNTVSVKRLMRSLSLPSRLQKTEHKQSVVKARSLSTIRIASKPLTTERVVSSDEQLELNLNDPSFLAQLELPIHYGIIHDDDISDDDVDDDDESVAVARILFDQGPIMKGDCELCFDEAEVATRSCCRQLVCNDCMVGYLSNGINDGKVHFPCPASACNQPVTKEELLWHIKSKELLDKHRRFMINATADANHKTCPHCCLLTKLAEKVRSKYGHTIICEQCKFSWCFECQSPSHSGIKCKENMKGLKALKEWAKEQSYGQRNARKCPKCKLLIQRTSGCDHMTCTNCGTDFCYKCGGKHWSSRLTGNHYDRLSIVGCPHIFLNGRKKHLRRFVRGSVFGGKLVGATVGSVVLVGLLPVALAAALFAGPVIGFMKLHRHLKAERGRKMFLAMRNAMEAGALEHTYHSQPPQPRRDSIFESLDLDEYFRAMILEQDLMNQAERGSGSTSESTDISLDASIARLRIYAIEMNNEVARQSLQTGSVEQLGNGSNPSSSHEVLSKKDEITHL